MANKISEIKVLEDLIKDRHAVIDGVKVEIGNFWSVLQIYMCIKNLGISIATLCKAASMLMGRLDSKYRIDESEISPAMIKKYLMLESSPAQVSHTVVTKTVSRGMDDSSREKLEEVLKHYNSYGEGIMADIEEHVFGGKPKFIGSKFNVMGSSAFSNVLKVSLLLHEMQKGGIISDMRDMKNSLHLDHIIKTIEENQKNVTQVEYIGVEL